MRPSDKHVKTNSDVDKVVLDDAVRAMSKSKQKTPVYNKPDIRRMIMKSRMTKSAAAAVIIIAVLTITNSFNSNHGTVFAQVSNQIDKAKTITWKETFYIQVTSKDGKRTWIETETRQCAYKVPGLYRVIHNETVHGQVKHEIITDTINLKQLSLVPETSKATLSELATTIYDSRGAFYWEKEYIKEHNLEWVGKRKAEIGEINVFRSAFWDKADNEDWSYDFWIDAETKQLIAVQIPGSDIYDPEKDPVRKNPPETDWSTKTPICSIKHDINYDVELDEALFRLEPPEGYTIQTEHRKQVTEEEMINFLGILAEYYNKSFPEQLFPVAVTSDKLNAIEAKSENSRTTAEQKLLETINHYKMANLNMLPIGHFIEDHTIKNSFRYIGKGVHLGDQDRIVCWYKLKDSNTYRAVYGDLTVDDIEPEDLPLKVEP
jgi:hypothetical protein